MGTKTTDPKGKPVSRTANPTKAKTTAEKPPDVGGQIDRLQKRARDLEAWQEEVEDAFARSLNLLIGSKREAAEAAEMEEPEA